MSRTVLSFRISSIALSLLIIGILVGLVLCIASLTIGALWQQSFSLESWDTSARQTLFYSLGSTILQVIVGVSTAWALFYSRPRSGLGLWVEAIILSIMMAIYCMQPVAVWHIFVELLGLPDQSLWSLILATGWQYSPFVAFFVLVSLKATSREEHELCSLESAWNLSRVHMIFFPALATVTLSLTWIRFAWNATKFELPYRFQRGSVVAAEKVLAFRLSQETHFRAQMYWGFILVVLIIGVLVVFWLVAATALSGFRRDTRRVQSGWFRRGGQTVILHFVTLLGAFFLLIYLTSFVFASIYLLRFPSEALLVTLQPTLTSVTFASIAAFFATGISLIVVFTYSRSHSPLTSAWTAASRGILAIPLVLIGALAYKLSQHPMVHHTAVTLYRQPVFSELDFAHILAGIRLIPALLAYVLFLTPLVFPVIHSHYVTYLPVEREDLPEVDGRSRGLLLFGHAVLPGLVPILALTAFLAFSIVLQDLSVTQWFVEGDLKFLSYELISLERSDTSGFTELIRLSFGISVLQGLMFLTIYRFLPTGGSQ